MKQGPASITSLLFHMICCAVQEKAWLLLQRCYSYHMIHFKNLAWLDSSQERLRLRKVQESFQISVNGLLIFFNLEDQLKFNANLLLLHAPPFSFFVNKRNVTSLLRLYGLIPPLVFTAKQFNKLWAACHFTTSSGTHSPQSSSKSSTKSSMLTQATFRQKVL